MNSITHTQRYYPHELKTRYHACLLYQNKRNTITYVCRRYKISKGSLMRWINPIVRKPHILTAIQQKKIPG